jgi:hypothetical protein
MKPALSDRHRYLKGEKQIYWRGMKLALSNQPKYLQGGKHIYERSMKLALSLSNRHDLPKGYEAGCIKLAEISSGKKNESVRGE